MRIADLDFEPFILQEQLQKQVGRVAAELNRDYSGRVPLVCPVLTGSIMFAADLLRKLGFDPIVQCVSYTSYRGTSSSGRVVSALPFPNTATGRDVLIVEDIIDTGLSMEHMLAELSKLRPASIKICTLFYKPSVCRPTVKPDYVGFEIGSEFIVGYGLDYNGQGRGLPDIYIHRT